MLIFIGVTIAISFNSWNKDRLEKQEEIDILIAMKVEFEENRELLQSEMNHLFRLFRNAYPSIPIVAITPSSYDIEKSSIYAPSLPLCENAP